MSKKVIIGIIVFCLALMVFGFFNAGEPYEYAGNWAVHHEQIPATEREYDVFYVYPTIYRNQDTPLMDWKDRRVAKKGNLFASAQTVGIFGDKVRVFAPFVRQLEYDRVSKICRQPGEFRLAGALVPGVMDTANAIRYYLKHFHTPGRPYILLGHSQGSMDLYEALKRCKEVRPDDGFVAAYLLGMPRLKTATILRDFQKRGITPATGAKDLGVIIVWNSQAPNAPNPVFAIDGGYGINPLNWRTDATPAGPAENLGAVFYDFTHPEKGLTRKKNFCGARLIPGNGCLEVDLPTDSEYDGHGGFFGKGNFHINDLWFFAENLVANANERVHAYKQTRQK